VTQNKGSCRLLLLFNNVKETVQFIETLY